LRITTSERSPHALATLPDTPEPVETFSGTTRESASSENITHACWVLWSGFWAYWLVGIVQSIFAELASLCKPNSDDEQIHQYGNKSKLTPAAHLVRVLLKATCYRPNTIVIALAVTKLKIGSNKLERDKAQQLILVDVSIRMTSSIELHT
jgi:hypothetical protein